MTWLLMGIIGWLLICVIFFGNRAVIFKCASVSCKLNNKGECLKKKVVIYDNATIGICLYHTESMHKRILEPLEEAGLIVGSKSLDELKNSEVLLKDPGAFEQWMRNQMRGKRS